MVNKTDIFNSVEYSDRYKNLGIPYSEQKESEKDARRRKCANERSDRLAKIANSTGVNMIKLGELLGELVYTDTEDIQEDLRRLIDRDSYLCANYNHLKLFLMKEKINPREDSLDSLMEWFYRDMRRIVEVRRILMGEYDYDITKQGTDSYGDLIQSLEQLRVRNCKYLKYKGISLEDVIHSIKMCNTPYIFNAEYDEIIIAIGILLTHDKDDFMCSSFTEIEDKVIAEVIAIKEWKEIVLIARKDIDINI